MIRLLLSLSPARLAHELGTGRALDNACRERDELAAVMQTIDALAGRLAPTFADAPASVAAGAEVEERVAA